MAKEYDNTNRGALFRNQYKKDSKHPDYKGKLNVEGKDFELSAWTKEAKDGSNFLSISVQEPYDKGDNAPF
jgi:uncharacterized protein (DUF736 family)